MKRKGMSFAAVRRVALALPGVEEGPCYGTPGFRVRGKFLARLREDGETLAIRCSDEEREFRLQTDPAAFFITDHYRGHPAVLIRLAAIDPAALREIFEHAWRKQAPKRLVAAYDAER